jgi:hypothetical protein
MQFIRAMRDTFSLMGAALSILHPRQYEIGIAAWKAMSEGVELKAEDGFAKLTAEVLKEWASPFTVAQVISNRESPLHCDTKGSPTWYDGLLTYGQYEDAVFKTPSLGAHFAYSPGTAIFLTSNFVEHGVEKVKGDRGCIANFMRPEVIGYALDDEDIHLGDIPTRDVVQEHLLARFGKKNEAVGIGSGNGK